MANSTKTNLKLLTVPSCLVILPAKFTKSSTLVLMLNNLFSHFALYELYCSVIVLYVSQCLKTWGGCIQIECTTTPRVRKTSYQMKGEKRADGFLRNLQPLGFLA